MIIRLSDCSVLQNAAYRLTLKNFGELRIMKFVEELIQKAQKSGEFKNLENEGEPLVLDENPYTAETRLAHGIIKNAGYKPQFINQQQQIKDEVKSLRNGLEKGAENWTGTEMSKIHWNTAVADFRARVAKLNRQIRDYNLKAPNEQFFIIPVDPEREIKKFSPENRSG